MIEKDPQKAHSLFLRLDKAFASENLGNFAEEDMSQDEYDDEKNVTHPRGGRKGVNYFQESEEEDDTSDDGEQNTIDISQIDRNNFKNH